MQPQHYPKISSSIAQLASLVRAGAIVAAPTETAYGLLADASNKRAVTAVVRLKGRESNKPIALVASDLRMVQRFFRMTMSDLCLAKKFWPGALTILLVPKRRWPKSVTGAGRRVGVRVPGNAWLRRLIKEAGTPLTATSANRAGGPTPYSAAAVVRQLGKRGLKHLVDGGALHHRSTSTIISLASGHLTVVREGAIIRARLMRVLRSNHI